MEREYLPFGFYLGPSLLSSAVHIQRASSYFSFCPYPGACSPISHVHFIPYDSHDKLSCYRSHTLGLPTFSALGTSVGKIS